MSIPESQRSADYIIYLVQGPRGARHPKGLRWLHGAPGKPGGPANPRGVKELHDAIEAQVTKGNVYTVYRMWGLVYGDVGEYGECMASNNGFLEWQNRKTFISHPQEKKNMCFSLTKTNQNEHPPRSTSFEEKQNVCFP